jgi:hypothetical protein
MTTTSATPAMTELYRLLDRLDTEDDDNDRADLIDCVFGLLDRHPNDAELRAAAVGYSDRFTA